MISYHWEKTRLEEAQTDRRSYRNVTMSTVQRLLGWSSRAPLAERSFDSSRSILPDTALANGRPSLIQARSGESPRCRFRPPSSRYSQVCVVVGRQHRWDILARTTFVKGWRQDLPDCLMCTIGRTAISCPVTLAYLNGPSRARLLTAISFRSKAPDHLEFRDGKVMKKDSYWKIVE